jgi:uncharacterized C2H2 Zn-finger protein
MQFAKGIRQDLKKRAFYDIEEMVEELFIRCPHCEIDLESGPFSFNISSTTNIKNMFGNWLNGIDKKPKARIRVGVCGLLWAIWSCRCDMIFNRAKGDFFFRLSTKLLIGFTCGLISFPRISQNL